MAVVSLHLYEEGSHTPQKFIARKMDRVPALHEHILAGPPRKDRTDRGWYQVKIVVHYTVDSDEGIDADVYAVKVDHVRELRQHNLVPKPPKTWRSKLSD